MFTLVYTQDGIMRRHPLSPGDTIVGRAAICDLPIDEASISRRHARFRVHGERCRLTDLGGRNGTFVNGEAVAEAELKAGDLIVLGRFILRMEKTEPVRVTLSEHHSVLETRGTVFRRVDANAGTALIERPSVDPGRLVSLLAEISRHLVRWSPLPEILERVAAVALDTTPAERAFLLLVDERTGQIVPQVARGRDGRTVEQASISRTIIGRTIGERLAMLATDAQLDPDLAAVHSVQSANVRSFMSAPLWNQTEAIGALYVDSPRSTPLTAADLDVLQALAAYAAVAIEQSRLTARVLEEARHRERLQRYHSSAVVEQILARQADADASLVAEERDLTVLFADIVGFTTIAEQMAPAEVANLLNRCFEVMCDAVFAEEGTLDKFIGDAVLAVFGAPLVQPDHAARAARAAQRMRQAMADLNLRPPMTLRIALNSGLATVGDIGSTKRREYTVLGDVVNTCSRLMSYACQPGQIVLTGATRLGLPPESRVRPLGPVTVRGRISAVEVFELDPDG